MRAISFDPDAGPEARIFTVMISIVFGLGLGGFAWVTSAFFD